MFEWFKERTRFAQIAGVWFDVTSIDTGDKGQVAVFASRLMKMSPMTAEDAWLSAVANWTHNMPYPESRVLLAEGIARFIEDPRARNLFSDEAASAAAAVALQILDSDIRYGPTPSR